MHTIQITRTINEDERCLLTLALRTATERWQEHITVLGGAGPLAEIFTMQCEKALNLAMELDEITTIALSESEA